MRAPISKQSSASTGDHPHRHPRLRAMSARSSATSTSAPKQSLDERVVRATSTQSAIGARSNTDLRWCRERARIPDHWRRVTVGHGAVVHGAQPEPLPDRMGRPAERLLIEPAPHRGGTLCQGHDRAAGSLCGLPERCQVVTPDEDASIKAYADRYVRYRLEFQSESTTA